MVASFLTFGLFSGQLGGDALLHSADYSLNDAQLGVLLAIAVAVAGGRVR